MHNGRVQSAEYTYKCIYVNTQIYEYREKTNNQRGYFFPRKMKITFAQKKIIKPSLQNQVKFYSCCVLHAE